MRFSLLVFLIKRQVVREAIDNKKIARYHKAGNQF